MSEENSLAKLDALTKPASLLIEKISDAVGGVFKPYQIVRIAKAEAEAELVRADSQIQVTDLQRRAMHRFVEEEAKRQSNIEGITQQAIPLLEDKAEPQNMADDWITNFFDKCRIISDGDMQQLWAQVLASEANAPGTVAKRTVNLLADLDRDDAELFMQLCSFGWMIGNVVPMIFNTEGEIYNLHGINFGSLSHLESLGLIQFNHLSGFRILKLPKSASVFYYGRLVNLTFPADLDNQLDVGKVLLTRAGQQLARVCGAQSIDGFFDFVYDQWASQSLVTKTEQSPLSDSTNS
jgi:Protein of unknown function (DUF2806)